MTLLIKNGRLIDPANGVDAKLNLLLEDGKIALVTREEPEADEVVDAAGKVVAPGFIDIHMHEDKVLADGHLDKEEDTAIFNCMLRMGVTTVLAGNCGENTYDPADFLDLVDREGAAVNVAMLAGHGFARFAIGHGDRYTHLTEEERVRLNERLQKSLDEGCFGISYGIRYDPGLDERELRETAALCLKGDKLIAAHVRSDHEEVFDAIHEFLGAAAELGVDTEVSHIGSMAGFGQMERFLAIVDEYRMNGLRVACDCYPYYAYCTNIGSATFDEGFKARYGCDYSVIEPCSGRFKGQRLNDESFEALRREDPECLCVCYLMAEEDVDMALADPAGMVGSDGIMNHGEGHPRAAGAFPRVYAQFVRTGKLSLYEAVAKMTAMPAEKLGLASKGRLNVGADADIVIFDPEKIADGAWFDHPVTPPTGIDRVYIGGQLAAQDCRIIRDSLGRALRKESGK